MDARQAERIIRARWEERESRRRAEELRARAAAGRERQFAKRPVEYCKHVLKISLTPDQELILSALHEEPFRVNVPSGNNTGKTFLAACALCYWFDSFPDGIVYTVAPRYEHVTTVIWGQVRLLRERAGLSTKYVGPKAPEIYDNPSHFARGITANKGESFQGRHIGRKLFIFDEATALDSLYFDTLATMFDPSTGDAVLAIYNPVDTTCRMYQEDMDCQEHNEAYTWHRFRLNCLTHPNVLAELEGRPKPFPGAVGLRMVNEWLRDMCEPIEAEIAVATDVEWPPSSGTWYRPGPEFQARCLGLWPDTGAGVWSDPLWAACTCPGIRPVAWTGAPELGVDCATGKGEDYFAIHAQWHGESLHHETSNTMDAVRIAGRVRDVARNMARMVDQRRHPSHSPFDPRHVLTKIDDDGTGNAVAAILRREGYRILLVGAGTKPTQDTLYPRLRDELWFRVAEKGRQGLVHLGKLERPTLRRLKQQLMAVSFDLDLSGRRKVETKDETKEKLGRSPDDADAFNLAYWDGWGSELASTFTTPTPALGSGRSSADELGLFGRRRA